jgi:hypothetical protein
MISGAATKASTSAWMIWMMSAETPESNCICEAPASKSRQQKGREHDPNRVGLPQQRHGDAVEADRAGELRGELVVETQRLDAPANPASPPAIIIVSTMIQLTLMPAYLAALLFCPTVRVSKPSVVLKMTHHINSRHQHRQHDAPGARGRTGRKIQRQACAHKDVGRLGDRPAVVSHNGPGVCPCVPPA